MSINSSGLTSWWTMPPVLQQNDNSEEGANDYIPLNDNEFYDMPIPANKEFGDYFLSLIHSQHAPVCEVAAWMHLTGEQIVHIFEGTAPAPNTEQLAVAFVLLSLRKKEIDKLTSLAMFSWYASGIDIQEQKNPSHSIFTERNPKKIRKETPTEYTAEFPLQDNNHAVKGIAISNTKTKTVPVGISASDSQTKKKQNEKLDIIPPNLRMKVKVFLSEFADGTIIEEITTKTGDKIIIDKTDSVERDSDSGFVHYRCSHGKHRIDLFREENNTWYMDAMPLAAENSYSN